MRHWLKATIDPNVRVRGNRTYVGIEDTWGQHPPEVGQPVQVRVAETTARGVGVVDAVDVERGLVYLKVDWASIR